MSATIGGILETKEIGLPIKLSGTLNDTVIDSATGVLRLKDIGEDGSGRAIYTSEGTWVSDVINLGDKFDDFDKVFSTLTNETTSSIAIQTRVSDNGGDWSEWIAVAEDGAIQSETKQYIQVKILLFAGFKNDIQVISDFKKAIDVDLFDSNNFIETSNGLRLKREYKIDMNSDISWIGKGSLHRKKITRDEWIRIDKMNVLQKE